MKFKATISYKSTPPGKNLNFLFMRTQTHLLHAYVCSSLDYLYWVYCSYRPYQYNLDIPHYNNFVIFHFTNLWSTVNQFNNSCIKYSYEPPNSFLSYSLSPLNSIFYEANRKIYPEFMFDSSVTA